VCSKLLVRVVRQSPVMRPNASRPLTIEGQTFQLCDKLSRRSFLPIGGLAVGGLSLPEISCAEHENERASSGREIAARSSWCRSSHWAVIMMFLGDGPPHQFFETTLVMQFQERVSGLMRTYR